MDYSVDDWIDSEVLHIDVINSTVICPDYEKPLQLLHVTKS